jgi:uncharacterized RDD family membrane protein YckC
VTQANTPPASVAEHRPAGIVTRSAAAGVDFAMVIVIASVLYGAVAGARFVWSPTTFQWPQSPAWFSITLAMVLAVLYLTATWAMTGRTYGDSLLGLRVLSRKRKHPGWALSFIRAVFCVLFPIGLVWVALSPQRRSVQDVVLRTVVVYDWRGAE